VIAETRIHASPDPYFRERLPWRRAGALDAGPTALCHLHGDVARGDTVRMDLKLDKAGQGVMIALPTERSSDMEDDPHDARADRASETSARPDHRCPSPGDRPLIEALQKAGASHVFVGESESWRRWPGRDRIAAMDVSVMPLDVTDPTA
jgi:hypothetical protein